MRILHTYLIIFIVFVVLLLVCSLTTIYKCKKHRRYRQKISKPFNQANNCETDNYVQKAGWFSGGYNVLVVDGGICNSLSEAKSMCDKNERCAGFSRKKMKPGDYKCWFKKSEDVNRGVHGKSSGFESYSKCKRLWKRIDDLTYGKRGNATTKDDFNAIYDYNKFNNIPNGPVNQQTWGHGCPVAAAREGSGPYDAGTCTTKGAVCKSHSYPYDNPSSFWVCDSIKPDINNNLQRQENWGFSWNDYNTLKAAHKAGYSVPYKGEIDEWSGDYCVNDMVNVGAKKNGHLCSPHNKDEIFVNKWESITDKLTDDMKAKIVPGIKDIPESGCPGSDCAVGMEGALCTNGYICKNSTQSIIHAIDNRLTRALTKTNMSKFGKTNTSCGTGKGPMGPNNTCTACPINMYSFDGTECKMCPITSSYAGKEFATVSGVGSSTCGVCPHSKKDSGSLVREYYSGRELCETWGEVAAQGAATAGYHSYYSWLYDHTSGHNFVKNANMLYKYVNNLCSSPKCFDITADKYKKFIRLATLVRKQTQAVRNKVKSCGGEGAVKCDLESVIDGTEETFEDLGEWIGEVIVDDIVPMMEKLALEALTDLWRMSGLKIIVDSIKDFIVVLETGKVDFSNIIKDFEQGGELWVKFEESADGIADIVNFLKNPTVMNDIICDLKTVTDVVSGKANINDLVTFFTSGICNEVKNEFNVMLKKGFDDVLIVSDVSTKICSAAGFGEGIKGTLCTTLLSASINRELKKLTRKDDRTACLALYNGINKLCYSANKTCRHTELKSCLSEGATIKGAPSKGALYEGADKHLGSGETAGSSKGGWKRKK